MVKQDHLHVDPPVSGKALPCPWCGGLKLKILFTDEDRHRACWVYCGGPCQASGPIADGEIDAVNKWNTRIIALAAPKASGLGKFAAFLIVLALAAAVMAEAVMA